MVEYTNSQINALIGEHIHNAKYRSILRDRYIDGLTYEAIAERHEMSVRQCKSIVYKAEKEFLKHF